LLVLDPHPAPQIHHALRHCSGLQSAPEGVTGPEGRRLGLHVERFLDPGKTSGTTLLIFMPVPWGDSATLQMGVFQGH
jgi:hypothetical protein